MGKAFEIFVGAAAERFRNYVEQLAQSLGYANRREPLRGCLTGTVLPGGLLTPPFHPYPDGRYVFCATFRGSLRAAVSGHPALWSPDFPPLLRSDRPTHSSKIQFSRLWLTVS